MKVRTIFAIVVAMFVIAGPAISGERSDLQNFFNSAAMKVKAATNPAEKREILNSSLNKMSKALEIAENSPLVSEKDKTGIKRFESTLIEKQDELAGRNGFERVPDQKLNNFADYVVQDTEQASQYITISVVTLLLIILLVVLIVH